MDDSGLEIARLVRRVDLPAKQLAGWRVRFQRGRERISRFFPDRAFGGGERAHEAALHFAAARPRDGEEVLALLRRLSPRKNSRFGVPGVTRLEPGGSKRGAAWVAYWNDPSGRKVQKKFAVSVHGEDKARELAFQTRRTATAAQGRRLAELLG